jgi:uncharacterized Zn finger protein
MYELTLTSRKQLERATLRAQAEKPRIEEVVFGIYKVTGSSGNLYLVGIEPAKCGEGYDVCCSCPTQKTFCKHVASVMPHYLLREKEMNQAQTLTEQEWAEVELASETEAILDDVRALLEKDRLDVFGY